MPSECLFSYEALRRFLLEVGNHFPWMRLGEWQGQRAALLRHDVDLSLEPAAALANKLHEWNITSTFLVLVSCPYYNVMSSQSRAHLRDIQAAGCEVGLHFDPQVYPQAGVDEVAEALREETRVLQAASGSPVRSMSLHNPHTMGQLPLFEGLVNAYDPRIFGPDRYLSDSCRNFRQDPRDFLGRVAGASHPIQILLHPLHYDDQERDYPAIFARHDARVQAERDAAFRAANPTYAREMS